MAIKNASNQKLIQEIIGLVVVAVIAIGYFGYNAISNAKNTSKAVTPVTPLTTTFNSEAIGKLNEKSTYPDVSPKSSELGKIDPFNQ